MNFRSTYMVCLIVSSCFPAFRAGFKNAPYILPKEFIDVANVLTTASDDLGDSYYASPAYFASSMPNTMEDEPLRFETTASRMKRDASNDHRVLEIDFGANISQVLAHIRTNRGYDKRIRPNYKGKPVTVGITLFISGVSQVSEANMDVTLDFYFRQFWRDARMDFTSIWNEELVIGGEFMREIWRPDTFFVNAKQSFFHQVTTLNTFLRISPTGNVSQSLRLTVTSSCPMDLRYFPMDSQRCSLEIESFGYTTRDIKYQWANVGSASVKFSNELQLPQFRIRGHRESYSMQVLSTGNYSRLVVDMYFERSLGYYIIQVYMPSSLIVMLSLVSFWISRESPPARVSLGITTVLTMTTLISSTNASLPKISYLKAIDIYLVSCFIMVFAALLEYAAVAYTGKRCRIIKQNRRDRLENAAHRMDKLRPSTSQVKRRQKVTFDVALTTIPILPPRLFDPDNGGEDIADEDDDGTRTEVQCCCRCAQIAAKASDIEKYSRIVFPTVFLSFNVFYWITFLNISVVNDEEGFIPVENY